MAIFRGSFLFSRALFSILGGEIARSPRVIFSLVVKHFMLTTQAGTFESRSTSYFKEVFIECFFMSKYFYEFFLFFNFFNFKYEGNLQKR